MCVILRVDVRSYEKSSMSSVSSVSYREDTEVIVCKAGERDED